MIPPKSRAGYLRHPLDALFGAPAHVAILRALRRFPMGATGRQLSAAAGLYPQAVLDGLARLEWIGLARKRVAGRSYLFELNRRHWLSRQVLPGLLDREPLFLQDLLSTLKQEVERDAEVGALFGSRVRGGERKESDLDVCLVVRDGEARRRFEQRSSSGDGESLQARLWEEFGVRPKFLVLTRKQALAGLRARRRRGAYENLQEDSVVFLGSWETLLNDSKVAPKTR